MNKYRNKKVIVDRKEFDSKKEAIRYKELKLLERAGEISNLELQPRFLLQDSFRKNGKTFRRIEYIADFKYIENGKTIVEDVKGIQTDVFKLKHKIFEKVYPDLELKIIKWKEWEYGWEFTKNIKRSNDIINNNINFNINSISIVVLE